MASWNGEKQGGVGSMVVCFGVGAIFALFGFFGCAGDAEGGTIPMPTPVHGVIVRTPTPVLVPVKVQRVYLPEVRR